MSLSLPTRMVTIQVKNDFISDYEFESLTPFDGGGQGKIYPGKNKVTKQKVAIKVTNMEKLEEANKDKVKTIIDELCVLEEIKNLKHDNIVRVFFSGIDPDKKNIYQIMEYFEKGDLTGYHKSSLNNKKISPDEALDVIYQVSSGLYELDKKGISHRDIKPQNILVDVSPDGKVTYKLTDFGQSCQKSKKISSVGTLNYMAPEILEKKAYDSKVDVWSLGVVLYEIMFGKDPFAGSDQKRMLAEINKTLYIPPGADKFVSEILQKTLAYDPKNRMSIKELFEYLQQNYKKITPVKEDPIVNVSNSSSASKKVSNSIEMHNYIDKGKLLNDKLISHLKEISQDNIELKMKISHFRLKGLKDNNYVDFIKQTSELAKTSIPPQKNLTLYIDHWDTANCIQFFEAPTFFPQLASLKYYYEFNKGSVINDHFIRLGSNLKCCSNLSELCLKFSKGKSSCKSQGMMLIADSIGEMKSLNSLELYFNEGEHEILNEGYVRLGEKIKNCQKLSRLFLEFSALKNRCETSGLRVISEGILKLSELTKLILKLQNGNHEIEDEGFKFLGESIQMNSQIKNINLSFEGAKNEIKIDGARSLARGLKQLKQAGAEVIINLPKAKFSGEMQELFGGFLEHF